MTSNPRFANYVERVQDYLSLFSVTDNEAELFLRKNISTSSYEPKFLIFEILFNHKADERQPPTRKFDPHVSSKLLQGLTMESALEDLERLYANADILRKQGFSLDWQNILWQTPEDKEGIFSDLAEEMKALDEIHQRVCGRHTHELSLHKLQKRIHLEDYDLNQQELETIQSTLKKLVLRYDMEYIPANLAATALIYEAWKQGKLQPLGNPEDDESKFNNLLDALFVHVKAECNESPLLEMARKMDLDNLTQVGVSYLSNGEVWVSMPEPWFACVEHSLIYKTLIRVIPSDTYIIHFPLIIDNYRFVGFCYLYSSVETDITKRDLPEVFVRSKYAKFYYAVQSVSETLRLSLRADAMTYVEKYLEQGEEDIDLIFAEVAKSYFTCFDVVKESDPINYMGRDPLNTKLLYANRGIEIYGPSWILNEHMDLLCQEIEGAKLCQEVEGANLQASSYSVPGLYEDVCQRVQQFRTDRERGKQDQASIFSHQAAGLVAEVWCDPKMAQLKLQSQGCLWQLKTLIDIWGNFDLEPDIPLSEGPQDFPQQWGSLNGRELLDQLVDTAIVHALRRATYRRAGGTEIDQIARSKALEMRRSSNQIALFKDWVGLQIEETTGRNRFPDWLSYRGFILCFHHCFWQSAFHGFRARCADVDNSKHPYLEIVICRESVTITNRTHHMKGKYLFSRDGNFYEEQLVTRLEHYFRIDGPKPKITENDNFWEVTITHSQG